MTRIFAALGFVIALPLAAQSPCSYRDCALAIVPTWNGLALQRGEHGPRVANLGFFWPRDVSASFRATGTASPGLESALAEARRALRIRRWAAAFTDGGVLLLGTGAAGALRSGGMRPADRALAAAGAAALGVSVPLQFAADGARSRAVWWHNLRFAR